MKCNEYNKYGHLFLSGELDKKDNEYFQKHMTECQECAAKAALEMEIISGSLEETVPVPDGLDEKILFSLNLKKDKISIFNKRYSIYSIAAAILLTVVISLNVYNNSTDIGQDQAGLSNNKAVEFVQKFEIFDDDLLLAYDDLYNGSIDDSYDLVGDEQDLSYDDDLYENVALLDAIY